MNNLLKLILGIIAWLLVGLVIGFFGAIIAHETSNSMEGALGNFFYVILICIVWLIIGALFFSSLIKRKIIRLNKIEKNTLEGLAIGLIIGAFLALQNPIYSIFLMLKIQSLYRYDAGIRIGIMIISGLIGALIGWFINKKKV